MTGASCQEACLSNDSQRSGTETICETHTHIHRLTRPLPRSLSLITITVKGRQSPMYDNLFIIIVNRFSQSPSPVCHWRIDEYQTGLSFVLGAKFRK